MNTPESRLAEVARQNAGVVSRRQANEVGVSDDQLRTRVRNGALVQVGPHAFRIAGAPHDLLVELRGLVADIGAPVWIAGPAAAAVHGFDGAKLRRPFHLVVPRTRSLNRWNVKVHRSIDLPLIDRASVDGLPITSAARTLIDAARESNPEELTRWLDAALRDGQLSEDHLHRRIVALRARGRHGIPTLHEVLAGHEVTRGGQSWLERQYLRLLAAAGLPAPLTQQHLTEAGDRLVRVDCRFPGTAVVVELLGYRWHRSRAQMARDAERVNALLTAGFLPYQFTYAQLVADQDFVVGETHRALARHGTPPPDLAA